MDIKALSGRGQRILVVDDMAEQRDIASRILKLLQYTVGVTESGEEAVEKCRKTKYDLLVLDMIMPGGVDGLATYH